MDAVLSHRRWLTRSLWAALGVALLAVTIFPQIDLGVTTMFSQEWPHHEDMIGEIAGRLGLNTLQVTETMEYYSMLRRKRAGENTNGQNFALNYALGGTINGIAAGLHNTG